DARLPEGERLKLLAEILSVDSIAVCLARPLVNGKPTPSSARTPCIDGTGTLAGGVGAATLPIERIVAAVTELARASAPETRLSVWYQLRGVTHPGFKQPLTDALLYDPDAAVRRFAIDAAENYLGDAVVRAALETAAARDASRHVR